MKEDGNKGLGMKESRSIGDSVVGINARINLFLDERKLSGVFILEGQLDMSERRWEAGSGKAIALSITTGIQPLWFQTGVRDRVEYKEAKKDPDQVISISNHLKRALQIVEKWKAGRKVVSRKTPGKGDER